MRRRCCCDQGPPPPCSITADWYWEIIRVAPPPCLIAFFDASFTGNGAQIVKWTWYKGPSFIGPWTAWSSQQDPVKESEVPLGEVEFIRLVVEDENGCTDEYVEGTHCAALSCCQVSYPDRAVVQYPVVDVETFEGVFHNVVQSGTALCTNIGEEETTNDFYSAYFRGYSPFHQQDTLHFFRVRICAGGRWNVELHNSEILADNPPDPLPPQNAGGFIVMWNLTGDYLGKDCRRIPPATVPFAQAGAGIWQYTCYDQPCIVSPA